MSNTATITKALCTAGVVLLLTGCSAVERAAGQASPSEATAPTPTAAPTPTPTPTETTPPPVSVTIAATGDVLLHRPVLNSAMRNAGGGDRDFDFRPMFADIAPLLDRADIALCHLETPLSEDNRTLSQRGSLVFSSPYQVADALADAGYDGCDFASNHTWDHGLNGLASTHAVMERAGLTLAGPAASEDAVDQPVLLPAGDATVAHLGYSYTIHNNWGPNTEVPQDAPWLERALWPAVGAEGIIADAEAARDEGADFVVVSMHWGAEYTEEPTSDQRDLARALLEGGAVDLILGTHVHIVQPCETINGRHVLHGLGNSLSNQAATTGGSLPVGTQEGMVAEIELRRSADGEVTSSLRYQPTRVNLDGHVIELATPQTFPETHARVVSAMTSLGDGACEATPNP